MMEDESGFKEAEKVRIHGIGALGGKEWEIDGGRTVLDAEASRVHLTGRTMDTRVTADRNAGPRGLVDGQSGGFVHFCLTSGGASSIRLKL